ncbi:CDP-glycerol glycerophosphotransferase family protein [Priestia megaterium]|uniref:CDP-glycerol glycerophosphotransferase family protein n=1 Tax=Priestia megaterium TaxID=1404 RepID=UPI00077D8FD5|nr:CDP-glycerol glycerophosphotransferase family protein [Priestia megaterium]USL39504.1 CDP-glycerol glycerophosphotransferase family protein [Priestia megaterium]
MEDESFNKYFNDPVLNSQDIQNSFEELLIPLRTLMIPNKKGKILINSTHLRIRQDTIQKIFPENNAFLITNSPITNHLGLKNQCIKDYKSDTKEISAKLVLQATKIFSKYTNHPVFGNSSLRKIFIEQIPLIVDSIGSVFNLYEKIPISSVIVGTTEEPLLNRTLVIVASMMNIPSLCLQHGIIMGEEAFMPAFASLIAVYGEYEKRWYMERGLSAEKIHIIGHPRYDSIFTGKHLPKQVFFRKFKINPRKLTLLMATGPHIDSDKFRKLIELISNNPLFEILIKPHPLEIQEKKFNCYLKLQSQYKSVQVITSNRTNVYDLLFNVDGLVASLSTLALEGLLFDKPVFVYDFLISNRSYDYYNDLKKYKEKDPYSLVYTINHYYSSLDERNHFEEVKNQFLIDRYRIKNSGEHLLSLINQIHEE